MKIKICKSKKKNKRNHKKKKTTPRQIIIKLFKPVIKRENYKSSHRKKDTKDTKGKR